MSREVKFHAWDKEDKKIWKVVSITESIWGDCEEAHIRVCEFHENPSKKETDVRMSVDYELMQYTGLKDKNGKEMYFDSDVVKLTVWHGYVAPSVSISTHDVIDGIDSAKYEYTGLIQKDRFGNPFIKDFYFANLLDADKYEFEILGNIYENPELLEEAS